MSFGYLGLGLTNEEWAQQPFFSCNSVTDWATNSDFQCPPGWVCNNYLIGSNCRYKEGPYRTCTSDASCESGWECSKGEYWNACIPKAAAVIPSGFNPPGEVPAQITCPEGQWPNDSFTACVSSTGNCSDDAVIKSVQTILRVHADGIWGPKSKAALQADGRTYQELAPGCVGPVPDGGSSGTGGGKYVPPTPKKQVKKPGSLQAGATGASWTPLLVIAAVGAVAWYMMKSPRRSVPNRRRRRR